MADESTPVPDPAPAAAQAAPAVEAEVNEADEAMAFLRQHGSKMDADGRVTDPDINAPITEEAEAAEAEPVEPIAETGAEPEAVEEALEDEEVSKPEANNFRVNLKDAADGERKRALIRLLKNEPGIDLAEAARRAGVTVAAAEAAAQTQASQAAPAKDPVQTLRDEIAALEREEDAAATAFDQAAIVRLGRELRAKNADLVRAEMRAERERETQAATQAQTHDAAVNSTWQTVGKIFPDAGVEKTPLHTALSEEIARIHKVAPAFFSNPKWPVLLTAGIAQEIGIAPKTAAPAPAAAPSPNAAKPAHANGTTVAARKPSTPAPPAPAPGRARSTTPAPVLTVPDTDDADELFAFLRLHGTRA